MKKSAARGFRMIKQELLRRIRERQWPPGHLLPGEVELAGEFGCARATVNRAMRELADDGFIDRKRRAGTRVRQAPLRQARLEIPVIRNEIEARGSAYRYNCLSRELQSAPDWLRAKLALPASAKVLHVRCLHFADNTPFQFEDRWIVVATVPSVSKVDFKAVSPNEWLVEAVPFTNAEFSFSAGAATPELAKLLALNAGEPVFVAERITWLGDRPVTFARMTFHTGYRMMTRI